MTGSADTLELNSTPSKLDEDMEATLSPKATSLNKMLAESPTAEGRLEASSLLHLFNKTELVTCCLTAALFCRQRCLRLACWKTWMYNLEVSLRRSLCSVISLVQRRLHATLRQDSVTIYTYIYDTLTFHCHLMCVCPQQVPPGMYMRSGLLICMSILAARVYISLLDENICASMCCPKVKNCPQACSLAICAPMLHWSDDLTPADSASASSGGTSGS